MSSKGTSNLYKIGDAARIVGVSVPTLRMYEREGLLIPIKSSAGTRYFDEDDIHWIRCIRRMITDVGLNIEGIRRLLALIPCWEVVGCSYAKTTGCIEVKNANSPCWVLKDSCEHIEKCHDCPVYRYSVRCENIKHLIQIRLKDLSQEHRDSAR